MKARVYKPELTIITHDADTAGLLKMDLTATPVPDTGFACIGRYFKDLKALCLGGGLGIAANQVGLSLNFFFLSHVLKIFPRSETGEICINPEWRPLSPGKVPGTEGCMSYPGRNFRMMRYPVIEAEWTNTQGHHIKRKLSNLPAVVFQHEHDHLRGVCLPDVAEEIVKTHQKHTKYDSNE